MNPINISKEQRDKLEEMIKKLFPEFIYSGVDEVQIDCGLRTSDVTQINSWPVFVYLSEIAEAPHDDIRQIPWFEFCTMHLPDKLFNNENQEIYFNQQENFLMNCIAYGDTEHPVDYLYKIFKNETYQTL